MSIDMTHHEEPEPTSDELLLQRFLDGELRPSERRDLEARLAFDVALSRRLGEMRDLKGLFAAGRDLVGQPVPLGVGFADRVWAEYLQAERERPVGRLPGVDVLKALNLLAATLAILLGGVLLLWRPAAPAVIEARSGTHPILQELERKAEKAEQEEKQRARARERPVQHLDGPRGRR